MAGAGAALVALLLLTSTEAVRLQGNPACECLNWKELYKSKAVWCGEFAEFSRFNMRENLTLQEISDFWALRPKALDRLCSKFMERLDSNICVPFQGSNEDRGSWCYVSGECRDLRGGTWVGHKYTANGVKLKRFVGGKICNTRKEPGMQRNITPEALFELAKKSNMSFGAAAQNIWRPGFPLLWEPIDELWSAGNYSKLPARLREYMVQNEPVLVPGTFGDTDLVLVWGGKAWEIYKDPRHCPHTEYCLEKRREEIKVL